MNSQTEEPRTRVGAIPWKTILCLAALYLTTAQGRIGNSDSASMLAVSRSLLEGHVAVPENVMGLRGSEGRWVSQFGVLVPILWTPFVLLGRVIARFLPSLTLANCEEFAVSFYAPCLMTFALVVLADIWAAMGCARSRIRTGLWVVGIGTLLWPFAKLPGSDATCGVLLLLAFRENLLGRSGKRMLCAGLWLGLMLAARKQSLSIVPLVAVFWTIQRGFTSQPGTRLSAAIRAAIALGTGMLPGTLLTLGYVWARFGSLHEPVYPGTEGIGLPTIADWITRAVAMLVGTRAGLLWYSGVLVVAFALAFQRMRTTDPWSLRLIVLLVASQIGLLACLPFWHGGPSFGPRYLLPVILVAATSWACLPVPIGKIRRSLIVASAVMGLLINFAGVLTDPLPVYWRNSVGHRDDWVSSSYAEASIVLKIARRPDWHSQHVEFSHPPFQVPDFWWCQVLQILNSRRGAHAHSLPAHPADVPRPGSTTAPIGR